MTSRSRSRNKKRNYIKEIDKIFGIGDNYKKHFIAVNDIGKYNVGYGEITNEAMKNIIKFLKSIKYPMNLFIDLGSGNGRALAYSIANGFKKSKGVELVEERYNMCQKLLEKIPFLNKKITVYNKDIFKLESNFFENNPVIFISNLLFPDDINKDLIKFLNDNIQHCIIFLTKIPKNTYSFKIIGNIDSPMSWYDDSTCYILTK